MASQPKPPYTAIELWTPEGPVYRRASTAPPRPAAPEEIPIVDLKGMGFTAAEKAEIVSAIKTAATAYGFFYVKNHGIPDEVVANALTQSKAFFSQSDEEKMLASSRKNPLRHGYSPVGRGQINRSEPRDAKESFQFRYQPKYDPLYAGDKERLDSDHQLPPAQGNDWIWEQTSHLVGFKDATVTWWQHCLVLARGMVRLFAMALDLPEDYFDSATTYPGSDGLYIHYPGTTRGPEEEIGVGSHTDMQCFTLLWQDMSGGLQLLSAQDDWVEATPIEGTLVVNIADFLQRLSNDRFRSTVHRVHSQKAASRYSMPFFFGFNTDTVLSVVPTCIDEENPPRYKPISCGEWREQRVALVKRYGV